MRNKLIQCDKLIKICDEFRAKGRKIGYTSGVFDLLHPGHVDYLEQARAACDVLVVGLNSDLSVRKNKGEGRPICKELDRAAVLSGLSCVDHIFIFEEENNNRNVELLKPAVYIKAGDYQKDQLTSAPIVEANGGQVLIIPFKSGYSTTKTIEQIAERFKPSTTEAGSVKGAQGGTRAVFLDRDGTLIEHVEYLSVPEKVKFIQGAVSAVKRLKDAGFKIVMVTNQPGISLGYFTKEDFFLVNRRVLQEFSRAGVMLDKAYFCPHGDSDNCTCRKPAPGMLLKGGFELKVDLGKSFIIGDTSSDIKAGSSAGCQTILVKTGLAGGDMRCEVIPSFVAKDLDEAVSWVLKASPLP